jgi:hypothetical protein
MFGDSVPLIFKGRNVQNEAQSGVSRERGNREKPEYFSPDILSLKDDRYKSQYTYSLLSLLQT